MPDGFGCTPERPTLPGGRSCNGSPSCRCGSPSDDAFGARRAQGRRVPSLGPTRSEDRDTTVTVNVSEPTPPLLSATVARTRVCRLDEIQQDLIGDGDAVATVRGRVEEIPEDALHGGLIVLAFPQRILGSRL